jgi:hypothetical protein
VWDVQIAEYLNNNRSQPSISIQRESALKSGHFEHFHLISHTI